MKTKKSEYVLSAITKLQHLWSGGFNRHNNSMDSSVSVLLNIVVILVCDSTLNLSMCHYSAGSRVLISIGRVAPMLVKSPRSIVSSFSSESTRACSRSFSATSRSALSSVSCCFWRAFSRLLRTEMLFSSRFFLYSSVSGSRFGRDLFRPLVEEEGEDLTAFLSLRFDDVTSASQ